MLQNCASVVTILSLLLMPTAQIRGAEAPCIGTLVLLKEAGIRGYTTSDAKKRSGPIQTWIVRQVLLQQGDRIRISQNEIAVWLAKEDVLEASKAVFFFTSLIESGKRDARNYACRAVSWHILRQYDKALSDHDEAIRLDSTNAEAFQNRATTWIAKDDIDRALNDYSSAIRIDPGKSANAARSNRAVVWIMKGNLEKALDDYNDIIRLDTSEAATFSSRANVWLLKMELDKALADLNEAVRLDPKDAYALKLRGCVWTRKGDRDKALSDLDKSIDLDPKEASAFSNRAVIWGSKGNYTRALTDCDESTRIDSNWPYGFYTKGWILAACPEAKYRDGRCAVESAIRSCELTGWKNPACLDLLAAAYAESREFDKAVRWSKMAIKVAESSPPTITWTMSIVDNIQQNMEIKSGPNKLVASTGMRERLKLYQDAKPYRLDIQK